MLIDAGDAAWRGEFLKLQRVVAGDHAVDRTRQLGHARLIFVEIAAQ
jgi:hypothetical protein